MKNHFRPALGLSDAQINAMCVQVKIYAPLVPPPKPVRNMGRIPWGQKRFSGGEVGERVRE